MSKMKTLIAILSAVVIGTSVASAVNTPAYDVIDANAMNNAAFEWKVVGYDTTRIDQSAFNRVEVVYQAFDRLTGRPSGPVVSGAEAGMYGLAQVTETKFGAPIVERAWPNQEYVDLFAKNPLTGEFEDTGKNLWTGVNRNLPYREIRSFWELAAPYRVITQTQADFGDGVWYHDATYPIQFRNEFAIVDPEYDNYYGFGDWHVFPGTVGQGVVVQYMPINEAGLFVPGTGATVPVADNNDAAPGNHNLLSYGSTNDDIRYIAQNGTEVVVADALDAYVECVSPAGTVLFTSGNRNAVDLTGATDIRIERSYTYSVTGPTYDVDGNIANPRGLTVNAANMYTVAALNNFGRTSLIRNALPAEAGQLQGADVNWVAGGYELTAPYLVFEYLDVDGVRLDGRLFFSAEDAAGNTWNWYLPTVTRHIVDEHGNYATIPVYSTWEERVADMVRPYFWNPVVGRYEFIIESVERVFAYDGVQLAETVWTAEDTGVYGTLQFTETWVNGAKEVSAVIVSEPIAGNVYTAPYIAVEAERNLAWNVRWGADASTFSYADIAETLDAQADLLANVANN